MRKVCARWGSNYVFGYSVTDAMNRRSQRHDSQGIHGGAPSTTRGFVGAKIEKRI